MGPKHKQNNSPTKASPLPKRVRSQEPEEVRGQPPSVNIMESGASKQNLSAVFEKVNAGPPDWFICYEQRLDERFKAISENLDEIKEKFNAIDFEVEKLKTDIAGLQKENNDLNAKIDDLENRSRRSNLVFYGIPELDSGKEDCVKTVTSLFQDFVGVQINPDHIDRCHRTPTFRVPSQTKPRIIHVAFSSFKTRELVRKSCIQKFKNKESLFNGHRLFVSEDFSRRVQLMRKAKMDNFKRLQQQGKKPFFVYPDVLKFRQDGKVLTYGEDVGK